ncbi:MAG: hypothetical protein CMH55_08785 [Myxococcales bacterium]|nr:hypothetical protein [Myxococcales bacterium]
MSVYDQWSRGVQERNADALIACLHTNYRFVRHQSGTEMNRDQMAEMLRGFMSSDRVVVNNQRCLYENQEIMVEHTVMDFADGTREAVLSFNRLQDGLIILTESGATPIER